MLDQSTTPFALKSFHLHVFIYSRYVLFPLPRYWAVTQVDYIHSRTSNRVFTMIFLVWFSAVIVSLAPQFGWKDPEYMQRIQEQKCMVSQDVAYQVRTRKYFCCTRKPLFTELLITPVLSLLLSSDYSHLIPQVFATCCTFYVPLLVILVLYWKIYQTARKRIRRRRVDKPKSDNVSQVSFGQHVQRKSVKLVLEVP